MRNLNFLLGVMLGFLVLFSSPIFAEDYISFELKSDKDRYKVGDSIILKLEVLNPFDEDIVGQVSGTTLIADSGLEIECYEMSFAKNLVSAFDFAQIQAMMSTSDTKSFQTIYSCFGSRSESKKTVFDSSKNILPSGEEVYTIDPFKIKYTFNGSDYEVESNSLNVTIFSDEEKKEEQSEEQQNEEQQNDEQSEEEMSQEIKDRLEQLKEQMQSQSQSPNGQDGLSQQDQQALSQNQQNQQTMNQIQDKINQIQDNKSVTNNSLKIQNDTNVSALNKEEELEKDYFLTFLIILAVILMCSYLYFKYFKKESPMVIINRIRAPRSPLHLELLAQVEYEEDYKNKVKLLAQSIREFIKVESKLKDVPTNLGAMKISSNELFLDVLNKAERIEFARGNKALDIKLIVAKLSKEYEKLSEKFEEEENKNE